MLSNRQNVVCSNNNTVVSAPLAFVDICDIDTSDDDDDDKTDISTNNNGLATAVVNEQCPNKQNSEQNIQIQSESNKMLTSSTNGYRQPRPTTINLQQITSVVKVTDKDVMDGCFKGPIEDSEHGSNGQGINVQFRDIIYRARREISWDRCKYTHYSLLKKKNKK